MLGYDYSIIYKKGSQNIVADALFRRDHAQEGKFFKCVGSISWSEVWELVLQSYVTNPILQQIYSNLQRDSSSHSKYSWDGKILRRKGKVVMGQELELRKKLFELFHSGAMRGHSGVHATRHRIASIISWKGLSKDIKQWVKECAVCQRCKYDNSAYPRLL